MTIHRRSTPLGVPADHLPKAPKAHRHVAHDGRVTSLIADGGEDATEHDEAAELAALDQARAFVRSLIMDEGVEADPEFGDVDDMTMIDAEHFAAKHAAATITHTHDHSAYKSQGSDSSHSHQHVHNGDASHSHHQATTTVTPINSMSLQDKLKHLGEKQKEYAPDVERIKVLVASAGDVEVEMAVRWDDEVFDPYWQNEDGTLGRKGTFVSTLPEALTAAGADIPQIVDDPGGAWHAYLCAEGMRTDEDPGREIMIGACQFPDLPVSMRLQIHDEGGHYGAVTCGRIDDMSRIEQEGFNLIAGDGVFGTDEHGQMAQLLVVEQTQRFVSIDPRDVDAAIVEIEICTSGIYDDEGNPVPDVYEWWVRYTSLVIGAATIVATPALQQAVITMANVPLPDSPLATERAPAAVVASGIPTIPRKAAFDNPGFHVGDQRLVRQPDGKYACPLTILDNGELFGHVAYWGQRHTSFVSKKVTPPRSKTALAHYLTGPGVECDGGEFVAGVGQITMGCGHAAAHLGHAAARAHYDGGYGAVQVADVRSGEDDFGIWIAGAMRADLTPDQVRAFKATNLSGDWREIGERGQLELLAVLAGVTVQGFPIVSRASLAAAGGPEVDDIAVRAGMNPDGSVKSLVAAGRVQTISPEARFSQLEHLVEMLMDEKVAREQLAAQDQLRELVTV